MIKIKEKIFEASIIWTILFMFIVCSALVVFEIGIIFQAGVESVGVCP